jgi:hypothetical protein
MIFIITAISVALVGQRLLSVVRQSRGKESSRYDCRPFYPLHILQVAWQVLLYQLIYGQSHSCVILEVCEMHNI